MKTILFTTAFALQMLVAVAGSSSAVAEVSADPITNDAALAPANVPLSTVSGGGRGVGLLANDAANAALTIKLRFTFPNTAHVANGTALRNRDSGWIALRGVPVSTPAGPLGVPPATSFSVVKAYLYWNFSDGLTTGAAANDALFEGNRIPGVKVADNVDPCWGMTGNHTYRGDVTAFIPALRPNGDYRVMLFSSSSTSGQNPWNPAETETIRTEGATLVVIYRGTGITSTVNLYDALSGSEFSVAASFTLVNAFPVGSSGLFRDEN